MVYLIVGENSIINKEIKSIKEKNSIDNNSFIKYDLEIDTTQIVIEELNTFNLFNDKKLVVVANTKNIEIELLEKYLNNPSDNILVLTEKEELDKRSKLSKLLEEKAKIINTKNVDLNTYIKDELKDYDIDKTLITLIKDKCNNNYHRITNEINKIKLYKEDNKKITKEDINVLIKKDLNINIYDLTNAINKKDIRKSLELFNDLLKNNEDEIKILGSLANNYRLLMNIKNLVTQYKDEEIIKKLKMHPYRLKMLKEQSNNYTKEEISKIINKLQKIDINIKSGLIDKKDALEMFLLEL